MAQKNAIEVRAQVVESLPQSTFRVELKNGHRIVANISGKMRLLFIRISQATSSGSKCPFTTSYKAAHSPSEIRTDKVMKVRASVKRLCESCKIVKRENVVRVICKNPRHKQKQG